MRKAKLLFILVVIYLLIGMFVSLPYTTSLQNEKEHSTAKQEIEPSPKNVKESTALYVYLFWMWLIIFVLIYILILKIREGDRVRQMKLEEHKDTHYPRLN